MDFATPTIGRQSTMSRSGYSDDCDNTWQWIQWRGRVASAMRGKRGQAFLQEMLEAMAALPMRRLIAEDYETIAAKFNIPTVLAQGNCLHER